MCWGIKMKKNIIFVFVIHIILSAIAFLAVLPFFNIIDEAEKRKYFFVFLYTVIFSLLYYLSGKKLLAKEKARQNILSILPCFLSSLLVTVFSILNIFSDNYGLAISANPAYMPLLALLNKKVFNLGNEYGIITLIFVPLPFLFMFLGLLRKKAK